MKKVILLAAAFVLLFQATAFAETKIGVVNVQKVLVTCEYGVEMQKQLQAKFEPLQKELEREAAELKKMETEMKNQDLALKLDAKQDRQRDFRRKLRDFQDSQVAYRQKFQAENQRLSQPIIERLSAVIKEYAKVNGFTVIIRLQPSVLYATEGIDISDPLVAALNELKKAGK